MNITEDQKFALTSKIQSWLEEMGVFNEDFDVVIGLQFIPRNPRITLQVREFPLDPEVEKAFAIQVSELGLPTMAENALYNVGIKTIRQVVELVKAEGPQGLFRIRLFGGTAYRRLVIHLEEKCGLKLGPEWRHRHLWRSWRPSEQPNV